MTETTPDVPTPAGHLTPEPGMPANLSFREYNRSVNGQPLTEFDQKFEQHVRLKRASRKWAAWKIAFWVSTIGLVVSQAMVYALAVKGANGTLVPGFEFFSATQWLSFNLLAYGIYAGADVTEKHLLAKGGLQ